MHLNCVHLAARAWEETGYIFGEIINMLSCLPSAKMLHTSLH